MLDALRPQNDVDTALDDLFSPVQGGAGRQLNNVDQVALVLLGDEAGRRARELDAGNADQPRIDHEHDAGAAHEPASQAAVAGREPVEAPIEAIESPVQQTSCQAAA